MLDTPTRSPLQGLRNIVRFNWPFYATGVATCLLLAVLSLSVSGSPRIAALTVLAVALAASLLSLSVSLYVYDISRLYDLHWLDSIDAKRILSINAGFDETSALLARNFPSTELCVCDFYDPRRHTEPSIRRARNAYPPYAGTVSVQTTRLPIETGSCDVALAIMSAHEVRDDRERGDLFRELCRCVGGEGQVIVVEHLRDIANLFAYNIGALHFHTRASWLSTFGDSGLAIIEERRINPWVIVFYLKPNGTAD